MINNSLITKFFISHSKDFSEYSFSELKAEFKKYIEEKYNTQEDSFNEKTSLFLKDSPVNIEPVQNKSTSNIDDVDSNEMLEILYHMLSDEKVVQVADTNDSGDYSQEEMTVFLNTLGELDGDTSSITSDDVLEGLKLIGQNEFELESSNLPQDTENQDELLNILNTENEKLNSTTLLEENITQENYPSINSMLSNEDSIDSFSLDDEEKDNITAPEKKNVFNTPVNKNNSFKTTNEKAPDNVNSAQLNKNQSVMFKRQEIMKLKQDKFNKEAELSATTAQYDNTLANITKLETSIASLKSSNNQISNEEGAQPVDNSAEIAKLEKELIAEKQKLQQIETQKQQTKQAIDMLDSQITAAEQELKTLEKEANAETNPNLSDGDLEFKNWKAFYDEERGKELADKAKSYATGKNKGKSCGGSVGTVYDEYYTGREACKGKDWGEVVLENNDDWMEITDYITVDDFPNLPDGAIISFSEYNYFGYSTLNGSGHVEIVCSDYDKNGNRRATGASGYISKGEVFAQVNMITKGGGTYRIFIPKK